MIHPKSPDWVVERAALGGAPAGFDVTEEELQAIADSNAEIREALPPAEIAAEVQRRLRIARITAERDAEARRARGRSFAVGLTAAIGAAVVLLLVVRGDGKAPTQVASLDVESGIRVKGDARLLVHRKDGDIVTELASGSGAKEGDLLQISYIAAGAPHGVVVSIDGRGEVTLHFPSRAGQSTALAGIGAVALDHSYRLDDAPDFERFVLLSSEEVIDVAAVVESLEEWAGASANVAEGPLPLPTSARQVTVLIKKAESL